MNCESLKLDKLNEINKLINDNPLDQVSNEIKALLFSIETRKANNIMLSRANSSLLTTITDVEVQLKNILEFDDLKIIKLLINDCLSDL